MTKRFDIDVIGSGSGITIVNYYISWSSGTTVTKAAITSPDSNIGLSTYAGHNLSDLTTPEGDTLDNYKVLIVKAEVYRNSVWTYMNGHFRDSTNSWGTSGITSNSSSTPTNDKVVVQTATTGLIHNASFSGSGNNADITGGVTSAVCRLHIIAYKQDIYMTNRFDIEVIAGGNGITIVDYYISWSSGTTVTKAATTSPDANMGLSTYAGHNLADLTTPEGDTLDNYEILTVEAEVYINSLWSYMNGHYRDGSVSWGTSGITSNSSSTPTNDKVVVQSGTSGMINNSADIGAGHNDSIPGTITSMVCRLHIVAYKQG